MTIHLLLIHQAFVSPQEAGGTRHYELARRLVADGHRVTIVASNLSYLTGQKIVSRPRLVSSEELDGIRVLRAYTLPTLHRGFAWRVVAFLCFMLTSILAGLRAGPVDVVMGTTPPIFQAVSAWSVAALRRRPFLLEVRDLWPEFAIDMGVLRNPALIRASRWLERFLYARADRLLVNSPAYREYLLARGIRAKKVSFIPNGVDCSAFDPHLPSPPVRAELGLGDEFVVVYTGALGAANDISTILRAAERLQADGGFRFLLAGDGKERSFLEEQARARGLGNVVFLGARPKQEIPRLLAAADACVATLRDIPMFRTTYPNKVFDYMAAGRPTLLAIDGVIREVLERAQGGVFVQPGDDAAMAAAVRELSRQPQHCRALGDAARAYVVANFDRAAQARQFVQLVARVAGREGLG